MPAEEPSTTEEHENAEATTDTIEPDAKTTEDPTESEPQTAQEASESQGPGEEPKAESEQTEPAGESGKPEEKPGKKKGGKGGKKGKKKGQQDEVKGSTSEITETTTTATESEAEGAEISKKDKTKKGKKKKTKERTTTGGDEEKEGEQPPTESKTEAEQVAGETQKDQKKKKKGKKGKSESTEGEAKDGGDTTAKKKGKKKKGKSDSGAAKEQPEAGDAETGGKKKKKGGKKGGKGGDKKKKKKGKSETATDTATRSEDEGEGKPGKKKKKGKKDAKKKKSSTHRESVTGEGDAGLEMGTKKSKTKGVDRQPSVSRTKRETSRLGSMIDAKSMPSSNALLAEFFSSSSSSSDDEEKEERVIATTSLQMEPVERQKKGKKGKKGGKKGKKGEKRKEPPTESTTETEEEPSMKEKKKKDKKGKKKKKDATTEGEDQEQTPAETEKDDVMAEIMRMKAMAAAQAVGAEAVEEPTDLADKAAPKKKGKKKKGPKKKMSKKEKVKWTAEMVEKARLEAEQMALRAAEEERIRLEQEKRAAIEKEKRETMEQEVRKEQLALVREIFDETEAYNRSLSMKAKELAEWNFYVSCDRLPDASKCDQITTYLHLWQKVIDEMTIEDAAQRTTDVLQLLNTLDSLIDAASPDDNIENLKWVRQLLRDHQAKSLDVATYRLLRNIEKNLNRIDIPTADFKYKDANLALCLWLRIQLPTPMPNPRRPPKPRIHINFNEMNMDVLFPESIGCDKMAIRAMYLKYDHLSDLCATYERPEVPEEYQLDLYDATRIEWREKMRYKYDNRMIHQSSMAKPSEDGKDETDEAKDTKSEKSYRVFGLNEEIPAVPYQKLSPTASEHVIANEESTFVNIRRRLQQKVADDEINLRKFSIIGGVYMLNLVYQPPQPQDFVTIDLDLTPLYIPKQLEFVDFHVEYTPPPPPEPGVRRLPEEIEEELKKQEQELDKLMLVTLTWPEHVIFLELPLVCFWDPQRRTWTKHEVHDLKHNEEKGQLTFRTGKLGMFALATYSYANLPYQAWEMRPEANGTITLQITAAILIVEFNVNQGGKVALSQLQNSPNNALQDIVGTYYELLDLTRIMQNAGVDVFPAPDAFCYVEGFEALKSTLAVETTPQQRVGTCEKHWPMEKHLYFNMAQMAICFNFAWSRWNLTAGRRNVVMQMREYHVDKAKQKNHSMLLVTPLKALFVDCTEVSQTFSEEGIEGMKFYSDLYHLMKGTSPMSIKNKLNVIDKELVYGLYEVLVATRVVSFS